MTQTVPARHRAHLHWGVSLVILGAIWGSSFLLIKIADRELAPVYVALGRMVFGAAALFAIALLSKERLPRSLAVWGHLSVAALLLNSLPSFLVAYGELRTTSVLAGIWIAASPLFAIGVTLLALRSETVTRHQLEGIVVGFVGVVVVLGIWNGIAESAFTGNLACLGAALSYGFGYPYTQKYLSGDSHSIVSLATGQLICASLQLVVMAPFFAPLPTHLSASVFGAVFVLGAIGTGIAYIFNYSIIRDAGATMATTVTYIIPLFSTLEGVIFLREGLTPNVPVGGAIVLLGVALSQGRIRPLWSRWGGPEAH
ncbi:MAG: DMT family transporter [Chloroflexota bacterium]